MAHLSAGVNTGPFILGAGPHSLIEVNLCLWMTVSRCRRLMVVVEQRRVINDFPSVSSLSVWPLYLSFSQFAPPWCTWRCFILEKRCHRCQVRCDLNCVHSECSGSSAFSTAFWTHVETLCCYNPSSKLILIIWQVDLHDVWHVHMYLWFNQRVNMLFLLLLLLIFYMLIPIVQPKLPVCLPDSLNAHFKMELRYSWGSVFLCCLWEFLDIKSVFCCFLGSLTFCIWRRLCLNKIDCWDLWKLISFSHACCIICCSYLSDCSEVRFFLVTPTGREVVKDVKFLWFCIYECSASCPHEVTSDPSCPGMRSGTHTWWRKMSCRSWRRGLTLTTISPAPSTCVNSTTERDTTSRTCCFPATTVAWSAAPRTSKWWVRHVSSSMWSAGEACQDQGQLSWFVIQGQLWYNLLWLLYNMTSSLKLAFGKWHVQDVGGSELYRLVFILNSVLGLHQSRSPLDGMEPKVSESTHHVPVCWGAWRLALVW